MSVTTWCTFMWSGIALSMMMAYISLLRFIYIVKHKEIYLEPFYFYFFFIIVNILNIMMIVELLKGFPDEITDSVMGYIYCYSIYWCFSFVIFWIASHYYIEFNEEYIVFHSIWFSKIVLKKELIDTKKSYIYLDFGQEPKIFKNGLRTVTENYIFYYNGQYLKILVDGMILSMKGAEIYSFINGKKPFKTIYTKNDYKEFMKKNKCIYASWKFVTPKRLR